MEDIEDPNFDDSEIMNSRQPTDADWSDESRYRNVRSEQDIHSMIIQPSTKTSYKIGKGFDQFTGKFKTGVVPSGYKEANSVDLVSANLQVDSLPKNYDERYNMACNIALAHLKAFGDLTGIDVSTAYNLVLEKRDLYNSMSKARGGKVLEYAFTNRSSMVSQGIDTIQEPKNKNKSWKDKVFGGSENE